MKQHFYTALVYISAQFDHATLCRLCEQVWSTVFLVVPITFFEMMRVCAYIYLYTCIHCTNYMEIWHLIWSFKKSLISSLVDISSSVFDWETVWWLNILYSNIIRRMWFKTRHFDQQWDQRKVDGGRNWIVKYNVIRNIYNMTSKASPQIYLSKTWRLMWRTREKMSRDVVSFRL